MDLIKNKIKQIDPRIEPKEASNFIQLIAFGVIPNRDFKCSKCNSQLVLWKKTSFDFSAIISRGRRSYRRSFTSTCTKTTFFQCDKCEKSFGTQFGLSVHLRWHNKNLNK